MDLEGLNRSLFLALNAPADLAAVPLAFAKAASDKGVVLLGFILVWRWLIGTPADRRALTYALLAVAPATALGYAISQAFPHPRPFMVSLGTNLSPHRPGPSLPSHHATFMWTVAIGLLCWAPARPSSWIVALLALLTSWARIFLGLHFPFDIAGSMVIALLSVAVIAALRAPIRKHVAEPIEALRFTVATRIRPRAREVPSDVSTRSSELVDDGRCLTPVRGERKPREGR